MTGRQHRHDAEAVRITTAAPSRREEIAARQRRYVYSMGVRTVCFLGAIAVGPGVLRWVLIAAAVFLPYVAVVMANVAPSRSSEADLPEAPGPGRQLPEAGRHDDD